MKKCFSLAIAILTLLVQFSVQPANAVDYSDTYLPTILSNSSSIQYADGGVKFILKLKIRTQLNKLLAIRFDVGITSPSDSSPSPLKPPPKQCVSYMELGTGLTSGGGLWAAKNPIEDYEVSETLSGKFRDTELVFSRTLFDGKAFDNNFANIDYCRGKWGATGTFYIFDEAQHWVIANLVTAVTPPAIGISSNLWGIQGGPIAPCPIMYGNYWYHFCNAPATLFSDSVAITDDDFNTAAAELNAKQEAEAKAAAELKAKQEADAKVIAELKAKREAEAKAEAELKAKQVAEAKAAAAKKTTITCMKGKLMKKVSAIKPVCPKGYKKK